MKKRFGALIFALTTIALSAACASSRNTTPKPPEPDSGETWARVAPSAAPQGRTAHTREAR